MANTSPYETWYSRSYSRLMRYTRIKLKGVAYPEDMAADIFMDMFSKFGEIQNPDAYFFKAIIRIKQKEALKKFNTEHMNENHEATTWRLIEFQDPAFQMEAEEISDRFNSLISTLSNNDREVYLSYRSNTLSSAQIREHYHLTDYTFRQLVYSVDQKLAAIFPTFAWKSAPRHQVAA